MMDDEIGKLMVVKKNVCEYCISVILQNSYIKMYYIRYWDCIMLLTRLYLLYPCQTITVSNFSIIGIYNFPTCLICIRSVCCIFYCMIKEYFNAYACSHYCYAIFQSIRKFDIFSSPFCLKHYRVH